MPWRRTDVSAERVKFVVRAASGQERMAALCREFGISRPTGYRWRRRFEQAGSVTAVIERSRRPEHSPSRTCVENEERVVVLRQKYAWGAKKLEVLLREQGAPLTAITIHRILKRRGLVRKKDSHPPALERFERASPNELWQMDGKGEYTRRRSGVLSAVDPGRSQPLCGGAVRPARFHGRAGVSLRGADDGALRCSAGHADGSRQHLVGDEERVWIPTWMSVRLIEQGIGLIYGRVHHPQTQGKVERFHRTLDEAMRYRGKPERLREWERALEEFRRVYNEERPHQALGMKRPAERYRPSARSYQAEPREWGLCGGKHGAAVERQGISLLGRQELVRVRSAGGAARAGRDSGRAVAGELPAHVRAGDRSPTGGDASVRPPARRREGSPVALRAPSEPSQRRTKPKPGSVTDVLIHGVTHVMIQNTFRSDK